MDIILARHASSSVVNCKMRYIITIKEQKKQELIILDGPCLVYEDEAENNGKLYAFLGNMSLGLAVANVVFSFDSGIISSAEWNSGWT